tara:strand:+ start:2233 stop:3153 length:921 start_codon:yes stop_codon:yes gene_type:complete
MLNIFFAGTPNSAAEILSYLVSNNSFNVCGVLTQPDKKGKRGNMLLESPVSEKARSLKLNIFKPLTLEKQSIYKKINFSEADILLVVAYGKLIPKWILESGIKIINIHYSLLPRYRGASPIQSALLNNDLQTGVTFMEMSQQLDAGRIISSFDIPIKGNDNKSSLEKKLTALSILNIDKVLKEFYSNKITPIEQDHKNASYCKKISKEDSIIDFKESANKILCKLKAYNEWPGISFIHNDKVIKIHDLIVTTTKSPGKPGDIIDFDKSGIRIKTADYDIVITYLQFPNKNIINSNDAYNSHKKFFI